MERSKLRPTVTITTYSASSSSFGKQHQQQTNNSEAATKSECSTNFFSNKFSRLPARHAYDISNNQHQRLFIDLSQIKGPTGSIRGHKDVVRKSLEGIRVAYNRRLATAHSANLTSTFITSSSAGQSNSLRFFQEEISSNMMQQQNNSSQNLEQIHTSEYLANLQEDELNQCVAYTTSLGIIRRTFEDSKSIKAILNLNLIEFEERDIFLNQEYKQQLKLRLNSIIVPAVFVDGKYIGGLKELETMNETGELLERLIKFKMSTPPVGVCMCCGNARFIACQSCNGSRKSTIHHFKFNSIALRCIKCDKNEGLVQCPMCSATSASPMNDKLVNINQEEGMNQSETGSNLLLDQNNNDNSVQAKILIDGDHHIQSSGC